jgi:uncharacterized protein (DUF885 family)
MSAFSRRLLTGLLAVVVAAAAVACSRDADDAQARSTTAQSAAGTNQTAGTNPTAGTAPAPAAAVSRETARLNDWFEAKFEEQLDFSPMWKTSLGRKDDYDRIDDFSEAGEDAQFEWSRQSVDELRASFDYGLLTPEAQTSYDLWVYEYDQAAAARPFRRRHYIFEQMGGPHTGLPQFLITQHRVDDESDMEAYIARIGEAARALGQALVNARAAADEGVHAPRFAYEAVIQQSRAVITGTPFDASSTPVANASDSAPGIGGSPIWADVTTKIAELVENGIIDEQRAAQLRSEAATALTERLRPAYEAIIAFAEDELPLTDAVATGVWKLPDGPAFYEERLRASTTTDMSADEIHELGLSEVARIQREMEAIKEQVGFDGTLQDFFRFIREDPQFYLPSTDAARQDYLDQTRAHLDFITARLPEFFGRLPRAGLEVRRVEAFREQPGAAQHYQAGTPDGSRPGIYYSHLIDMSAMPLNQMENIAYHEGLPGHHMQISIAQELTGVPTFRTQYGVTAYIEGWGLYAELLAKDMGAYQDPYSDFGRLTGEIWRAIRLVVDTGLHARGWTEDEAVAYFAENSPLADGQIRAEVRRYIVTPGQATAYKIGMLKLLELRERARSALGEKFDIRAFHDTVLGGGALPLAILERRVDDWIAANAG